MVDKYPLDELKLIYRVLHRNISQHADLLDSQFFADVQTLLQRRAQAEGVDVADHGAWDSWLNGEKVNRRVRHGNGVC